MVLVRKAYGFRFVIYTADHEPAHVHIVGEGKAKINLLGPYGQPEVVYSVGIKRPDMKRLLAEVAEHRQEFLEKWLEIYGDPA